MDKNKFVNHIPEPWISQALFGNTSFAWLWLLVRLYVGWVWLSAGLEKLGNPVWTGPQAGVAVKGFIMGALAKTGGAHPDVSGWYADFLQTVALPNAEIFAYLVTYGEIAIGIALILGLFVGIASFFGIFMNYSFLLAGTVSANPILVFLGMLLLLAWRVAGWYGLDRYALPFLGVPWKPGKLFIKN